MKKSYVVLASVVVLGVVAFSVIQQNAAAEVQATAEGNCQKFINKELNPRRKTDPAYVIGTWRKGERIVVEVAWRTSSYDTAYESRLCVYDPNSGRMSVPNVFGRSVWENT
ncbi:hypothetical protein NBRC116601_18400 [Cognatishimia sp. WU-CL00825]|uniref:hypothetical protein n=1 Tax=Cognatishimia sp. WU-CL00825 TaxID=3127658 RepID=UPI00310C7D2D